MNITSNQTVAYISPVLASLNLSLANFTYAVEDRYIDGTSFKFVTLTCVRRTEFACGMLLEIGAEGAVAVMDYD